MCPVRFVTYVSGRSQHLAIWLPAAHSLRKDLRSSGLASAFWFSRQRKSLLPLLPTASTRSLRQLLLTPDLLYSARTRETGS
jgi:hypothetical protein